MIPQDLHYEFPYAVYLIFVLFLFALLFWALFLYRKKALNLFSSKENLQKLLIPRSDPIYFFKVFIFCLVWVLSTVALMQPKGDGYYPNSLDETTNKKLQPKLKAHDVVFLIDASLSMSIQDSLSGKSRLDLAKEIADEIASSFQGESAALYAFTTEPTKMSPPTLDLFFVRMMLRNITINEGNIAGTDFLKTLEIISKNHFHPSPSKLLSLIILSDGGDTLLETLEGQDRKNRIGDILKTFQDPKKLNLRVFTVGIGSLTKSVIADISFEGKPVYSKLDEELLKIISENGRGVYYSSNNFSAIQIAKGMFEKMKEDDPFLKEDEGSKNPKKAHLLYHQYYQIPLGMALLLLSIYLLFPNISIFKPLLILFFCFQIPILNASIDDLKRAQNFFEAGEFSKSEAIYQEMLEKKLDSFERAVTLYNQGTSLIFQNEWKKAIDVLESISLKGHPPPFLIARIKTNLSVAKYRQALDLLANNASYDDQNTLEKIAYLLKESEQDLISAEKAHCELQVIEGRDKCEKDLEMIKLNLAIQSHLKTLSKKVNLDELKAKSLDYFQKKIQEIFNVAMLINPQNLKDLHLILQKAIDVEQETLIMTRNLYHLNDLSNESIEQLMQAQNKTLQIADFYFTNVFKLQHQLYEAGSCQKKPWNEIIPLYHKGYQAAVDALDFIPKNLEKASLKQEESLKYWKEILNTLKKNENEEKVQENQSSIHEELMSNQSKNEQALQLLQEMQSRDRKQKMYPNRVKTVVERPW